MAVSPAKKLTYEEWLDFPTEEGVRTELIDGEVWVAMEPTLRHQVVLGRLFYAIETYIRSHGGGHIALPVNVRLDVDQGFGPDLVFFHEWGDDPLTYHGAPPWVIEVVSDPRRDLRIKRDRYERYGVAEYWAVLPEAEQVQIFRMEDRRYGPPMVYEAGDTVTPGPLPGLAIDLGEIFA
ncbi:MAG: Uma2 family endonuclease [Actinomycetota bacterium]